MKVRIIQRYTLVFTLFTVLGLTPLTVSAAHHEKEDATTSAEQVSQDTQELLESLKKYSADQKDEAVKATQEGLNSLDKNIDELQNNIEKNWDNMDQAAREKSRKTLKSLQEQRVELAEWYGSMKSSSAGAWEHVKSGFSDAYDNLSHAWQKASEEFAQEEKE
ncbi:hypothetical protein KDD30_18380 (plasmid) [Photobacterium sp. GJ3]|uniref:hypothetical protein n=1 Tax=Photobacterium sp. GJ3 TaxID=2829502 RepID=UPI001B8DA20D|nr:hypothetical protein [Photobacterium sp. GJ3]QUJ70114.1 hypothetical protein KDD30_18380 [Photobacterium sp. GJ3]